MTTGASGYERDAELRLGDRLGHFRIVRKLGCGGMGCVYAAVHHRDETLRRALKVVRPELFREPELRWRFRNEAEIMSTLRHRNIVDFVSFRELGDNHVIEMELMDGIALSDPRHQGPSVPTDTIVDWLRDAAAALAYLHRNDALGRRRTILHRDIKPANLFLTREGVVKVLDLGLAKATLDAQSATGVQLTKTGALNGTPGYIGPELLNGAPASPAVDVFALGVTVVELCTGRHPFLPEGAEAIEAVAMAARTLFEEVPRLTELRPDAPPWLADLVEQMLQKDPQRRLQDGVAVFELLQPGAGGDTLLGWRRTIPPKDGIEAAEAPSRSARGDGGPVEVEDPEPIGTAPTQVSAPGAGEAPASGRRPFGIPPSDSKALELRRIVIRMDEAFERYAAAALTMADSFRLMTEAAIDDDPSAEGELTQVVEAYNAVYGDLRTLRRRALEDLAPFWADVDGLEVASTAMWETALEHVHQGTALEINRVRAAIFKARRLHKRVDAAAKLEAVEAAGVELAEEVADNIAAAIQRLAAARARFRAAAGLFAD